MSNFTSDDLQVELQRFAEKTLRSQLSDFSKAIQDGICRELQRIQITSPEKESSAHKSSSVIAEPAKHPRLPGETQVDNCEVTPRPCTLNPRREPAMESTLRAGEAQQEGTHIVGYTVSTLERDRVAAEEKLGELRAGVANGYYQRCNARSGIDLSKVPGFGRTKDAMLRASSTSHTELYGMTRNYSDLCIDDVDPAMVNSRIAEFICSDIFEYIVCFLIVTNAIFIGIVTQQTTTDYSACDAVHLRVIELSFFMIFAVELGLRIYVFRSWFLKFLTPQGTTNIYWTWNLFDSLIVLCQAGENILVLAYPCREFVLGNATVLRVMRLLRIGRLMRVGKLMHYSDSLRVIGKAVQSSLQVFLWAFCLLLAISYLFAIYFTEMAMVKLAQSESADEELKEHWGTLFVSWMSLLQAMSGGIDWGDLARPLERVGFTYALFPFLLYVFFMLIVLMNVFTGTFLEPCLKSSNEVREELLLRNALEFFKLSDHNDNNKIAKEDFKNSLKHRSVNRFFDAIDLELHQAEVLFELLDTSGDGQISCDEFLCGCVRLQGKAKALDLLVLSREVEQLFDSLVAIIRQNAATLKREQEMIDEHMHASQQNHLVLRGLLDDILKKV